MIFRQVGLESLHEVIVLFIFLVDMVYINIYITVVTDLIRQPQTCNEARHKPAAAPPYTASI